MKRLWGIRHIRWWWLAHRAQQWASSWGRIGFGMGVINEADARYLDAVWRGEI